jgi:hypothetical protein
MTMTGVARDACKRFDDLAARQSRLESVVRTLGYQLQSPMWSPDQRHAAMQALDQAQRELASLGPQLQRAWAEIAAARKSVVKLPPPARGPFRPRPRPVKIEPVPLRLHIDSAKYRRMQRLFDNDAIKAKFCAQAPVLDPFTPAKAIGADYVVAISYDERKVLLSCDQYERQLHSFWRAKGVELDLSLPSATPSRKLKSA